MDTWASRWGGTELKKWSVFLHPDWRGGNFLDKIVSRFLNVWEEQPSSYVAGNLKYFSNRTEFAVSAARAPIRQKWWARAGKTRARKKKNSTTDWISIDYRKEITADPQPVSYLFIVKFKILFLASQELFSEVNRSSGQAFFYNDHDYCLNRIFHCHVHLAEFFLFNVKCKRNESRMLARPRSCRFDDICV